MNIATASLLAALALLSAGCATSVNTIERATPESSPDLINDKRIVTDSTLARKLRVQSLNQSTVSGNLLKVQATLENLSSRPKEFAYKFDWIADDGMELPGPTGGWKQIALEGKEVRAISIVATSPKAVDFRLKFKEL